MNRYLLALLCVLSPVVHAGYHQPDRMAHLNLAAKTDELPVYVLTEQPVVLVTATKSPPAKKGFPDSPVDGQG